MNTLVKKCMGETINMKYWKTASGEKITLNKLTDYHLDNIINMMERNAVNYTSQMTYPIFSGEFAQIAAESLYEELQDNPLGLLEDTIYDDLIEEQDRRRIEIKRFI